MQQPLPALVLTSEQTARYRAESEFRATITATARDMARTHRQPVAVFAVTGERLDTVDSGDAANLS